MFTLPNIQIVSRKLPKNDRDPTTAWGERGVSDQIGSCGREVLIAGGR